MPRIPVAIAPRASPGGSSAPMANPDAARGTGGEALAAGAERLAQGVSRLGEAYDRARDEADAAAVEQQLATFGDAANKQAMLYRQAQGEQALNRYDPTRKTLDELQGMALENLADDRQKQVFRARAQLISNRVVQDMDHHQTAQIGVLHDQAYAANEAMTLDTLKLHANDADVFAPSGVVQRTIDTYTGTHLAKELERKGVSSATEETPDPNDATKTILSSARSTATEAWRRKAYGVVMQALVSPPDGSRASTQRVRDFYGAHSKDLGPDVAEHFAPIVRELGLRQDAEDTATKLVEQHSRQVLLPDGRAVRQVDGPALNAAIQELQVPAEVKEKARQIGESVLATYEKQWGHTKDTVYSGAFSAYLKAPRQGAAGLAAIPAVTQEWLKTYAPEDWQKMRVRAHEDDKRAKEKAGASPDQMSAFSEFLFEVKAHPEKYAADDYSLESLTREWGSRLATKDLRKAAEEVATAKGQMVGQTRKELPTDIAQYIIEVGGPKGANFWKTENPKDTRNPWSEDQVKLYYTMRERLERVITDETRRNGKRPDDAWVKDWINRELMAEVKVPGAVFGSWWPTSKRKIQVEMEAQKKAQKSEPGSASAAPAATPAPTPAQRPSFDLLPPGVPADFAAEVHARAQAEGRTIGAAQLVELWRRSKSTWKKGK